MNGCICRVAYDDASLVTNLVKVIYDGGSGDACGNLLP